MKPLALAFPANAAQGRRRPQVRVVVMSALAVFAGGASIVQGVVLLGQIDQLRESAQAVAPAPVAATSPEPRIAADPRLARDRVASVNAAVMRLNLPWPTMLDQIERAGSRDVGLIAIEPDMAHGVVRLLGEASGPGGMVDYVRGLSAQPAFAGVTIIRHRLGTLGAQGAAAGGAPLEFTLELAWRDLATETVR